MTVYPIRKFGDPVLNVTAQTVTEIDDRLQRLIDDMTETMYEAPGVGLAAPQIGVHKRLFVYDAHDELGPRVVMNPEIVNLTEEWEYPEGCLSVPGLFFHITRPRLIHIRYTDRDGNAAELEAEDFHARVLQHEIDHLDGKLLISRLNKVQRKEAMKALRNPRPRAS